MCLTLFIYLKDITDGGGLMIPLKREIVETVESVCCSPAPHIHSPVPLWQYALCTQTHLIHNTFELKICYVHQEVALASIGKKKKNRITAERAQQQADSVIRLSEI